MTRLLSFFVVVLLGAQGLQAQWIQTFDGDSRSGLVNAFAVKDSNLFAGTGYACFVPPTTAQAGPPSIAA